MNLKGGKVGLIENSRNICARTYSANVKLAAHNGRKASSTPVIKVKGCKGGGKGKGGKKGKGGGLGLSVPLPLYSNICAKAEGS